MKFETKNLKLSLISIIVIMAFNSCTTTNMKYTERQLTKGESGHFLNPTQVFSKDGEWIVFDKRNDGGQIGSTSTIAMVNVKTGEVKELYKVDKQTEYGPGVGAATFSPTTNRVLFIHGIRNANAENPYSFTRRTGVAIDIEKPNKLILMDARDVKAPFTPGALRGGTHAHSWSGDGKWISFTYNDFVLEQLSKTNPEVQDLRVVGVMVPKKVTVNDDNNLENNSGEMFSVVVTKVTEKPAFGSDEIDKAFDECWIGTNGYKKLDSSLQKRAIAFQGNVKDANGKTKTEVFIIDLPDDITQANSNESLEGTSTTRPGIPLGVRQRRITFTENGIEGPRHWLQTKPDGSLIAFLAKDKKGFINAFGVSPNGGEIRQLTFHDFDIQTGFNFSPDGKYIAYGANNAVYKTEVSNGESEKLTPSFSDDEAPVNAVNWSTDGQTLVYNRYFKDGREAFLQIFAIE